LQYPQTGRTLCNRPVSASRCICCVLAVPSDGSNPMQPYQDSSTRSSQQDLQYPQTGRTLCNPKKPSESLVRRQCLAVPSDGSNPMQLTHLVWREVVEHDLAVPSDGSNPMQRPLNQAMYLIISSLQYPQTGRTLCNLTCSAHSATHSSLQYPQTGRTLCNFFVCSCIFHRHTLAVPSDGSNPMQRDRGSGALNEDVLAVPSDGSNPMQHGEAASCRCPGL